MGQHYAEGSRYPTADGTWWTDPCRNHSIYFPEVKIPFYKKWFGILFFCLGKWVGGMKKMEVTYRKWGLVPLAKAAKKCGYDICWLDFSKIPEESALKPEVIGYCYMGNLGENQMTLLNRIIMRAFPYTYRIWGSPASMYDGMIFVTEAHPIQFR